MSEAALTAFLVLSTFVFAAFSLIESRGRDTTAWAVVLLALALISGHVVSI